MGISTISAEKVRLYSELEELRRQLAVTDLNSKNYVEEEKRRCSEQIASLERLLHGKCGLEVYQVAL